MISIVENKAAVTLTTYNGIVLPGVYQQKRMEITVSPANNIVQSSGLNLLNVNAVSTAAKWGNIIGVLTSQADLVAALLGKANALHAHTESDIADLDKYTKAEVDEKLRFSFGTKQTGVDGGTVGDVSVDDDYLYVCVVTGGAGVAVWKKSVLFKT